MMKDTSLVPETGSASDVAVLLIHGFTGSTTAMRPWADSLQSHGVHTSVPILPGHETRWQDLIGRPYGQWIQATEDAFDELASAHQHVFVAGLSMGGALALHLASRRNVSGVSLVNPGLVIDSPVAPYSGYLRRVVRTVAPISNDIAYPGADENAYERTPVAAVHEVYKLFAQTRARLPLVAAPVQLLRSAVDNVVSDASVHALLNGLGPGILRERIALSRSRHVATLDYDAPKIFKESLRFITDVAAREEAQ
ncbi:esterase [Arthrobacter sp. MYb211]|uniref:alpha/beta hydrolase n=1 Tax=unclassified Arthrobacter TaxID=235627 RepID=UPI000CFC1C06|nr:MULTISPECIES: alpha/beta fold hydrolase [unclassified Arthrobacter]PRA09805.1 esterase [Arthrobacter sp. MYb221]PRC04040.1 esterase [Arthrobacter sp. MYb211]